MNKYKEDFNFGGREISRQNKMNNSEQDITSSSQI